MQSISQAKANQSSKFSKMKKYWPIYVLALPAIILMIVYKYIPMFGLYYAFTDFSAGMPIEYVEFVGFKWFEQLFTRPEFPQVIWNTLSISFLKLLFGFPAPIILAILLNEMNSSKVRRISQTVLYMPHFLSWTILAGIIFTLLSSQSGIVKYFGVTEPILLNEDYFVPLLIISDIWKSAGWGTIVYLAAISGISPEFYEAAMIDGAKRFQRIIYITIPCISSTIVILLILRIGNVLDAGFDQVFMLSNSSVIDVADILDTYVFRMGMQQGRFAIATAAGLFKSLVGLVLVLSANKIAKFVDPDAGIL